MTEYQVLGLMLLLQGVLATTGVLVGFQTPRETRAVFRPANEALPRVQIISDTQERTASALERLEKRLDDPRR